MKIGELERMEVEADVLSQDVVDVKEGQQAEIYGPAIGREPVPAKVTRIFPAGFTKISSLGVEQQRVKVVLSFDPRYLKRLRAERQLGVDFRVGVRIFTANSDDALIVPRSALFRGAAGQWQVFAVRNGRVQLIDVGVGLMNDELVEIADGLAEDEVVVLAPETTLVDGMRVRPILSDSK
jgi:HlyD family secretion protein